MVSARGERAAVGGYTPQYIEFARKVYDCILNESLVEIRVADSEENVGKLDDICYVTKTEVHAYQIKWTINDSTFGYSDFKGLLPKVVEGWLKLRKLYPDRMAYPYLLTNRRGVDGQSIEDNNKVELGYFSDFRKEVLGNLQSGAEVPTKWNDVVSNLRTSINNELGYDISDEDFTSFWKVFVFATDYKQEKIRVIDAIDSLRAKHILQIVNLIMEMAASEEREVVKTCEEIIKELGWGTYMKRRYDHNLAVTLETYEPLQSAIDLLNAKLKSKTKGYIFVEGTPGSGKSTLITSWVQAIPNKYVRYYAFDFTKPSSQWVNDAGRGDKISFMLELISQLGDKGYSLEKKALLTHDEVYVKEYLWLQFEKIHEEYNSTHVPVVIIVDGLDHIEREYATGHDTLLEALPTTEELPEGVVFVLGSQYYKNMSLNAHILHEYENGESTIVMPPFTSEEIARLSGKILGYGQVTEKTLGLIIAKSAGHPLYLRYLLCQLKENPQISLESLPEYNTNIEVYYSQVLGKTLQNDKICQFFGLLSRLYGEIKDDFLREWQMDGQILKDSFRELRHLFIYNPEQKSRTFFHNSFRQYLLRETAIDCMTNQSSEELDRSYYHQLAKYLEISKVEKKWEIGRYLHNAGDDETFIRLVTPDSIIEQIREYRPLWHAQRDVEWGAQIAAKRKDTYLLVRMLLLHSQIDQMQSQEYDASSLIEEFLQLGKADIAKSQIRDEKRLHCSQDAAIRLVQLFYDYGDEIEARLLFEQSYPMFLSEPLEEHLHRDDLRRYADNLKEWVHVAAYFKSTDEVDEKIGVFVDFLKKVATAANVEVDERKLTYDLKWEVILSLEHLGQWDVIEEYQKTFDECDQCKNQYKIQRDRVLRLISKQAPEDVINEQFGILQEYCNQLQFKQADSINLMMASVAANVGMADSIIKLYLDKVQWENLPSFETDIMYNSGFDRLRQRIRYVELRSRFGYEDAVSELVAREPIQTEGELLSNYLRMVYKSAQWNGGADIDQSKSIEFIQMVKPYLLFFDGCVGNNHDKHAYNIEKQRGDFYEYMVKTAARFGIDTIRKVGCVVQELYGLDYWRARAGEVRQIVRALFQVGIGKKWVITMLDQIENRMYEGQDIYGKQTEAIQQGKIWIELGESERALHVFQQMVIEASGVGYHKEYQPSTMARWIGAANRVDIGHAGDRIHWMTQRLQAIADSCETRTAVRAGEKLLDETIDLNLGMGVKLGKWLLDAEIGYFEDVSFLLMHKLLERCQTEHEYDVVYRYFTQLHLYIQNDGYDVNTGLLEKVYAVGKDILRERFSEYAEELKLCILTQCNERVQKAMLHSLGELENPPKEPTKEEREDNHVLDAYKRDSEIFAEEAEMLWQEGKTEEAWAAAIKALQTSNSSGWAAYNDGGTRLNACKLLVMMDKQKGREITMKRLADDLSEQIGYGAMQYIEEIVSLLEDTPDVLRLFEEELGYMNRMIRRKSVREEDSPDMSPNGEGIIESMARWLIFIMKMPILCVADKAKVQLAKIIDDGADGLLELMQEEGCDVRDILEVGMYLKELRSAKLSIYIEYASQYATHDNYLYRIYAKEILNELQEALPEIPKKRQLPVIYKMILPERESVRFENPAVYEGYISWDDPQSVTRVCGHIVSYIAYCTNFKKINIATRVMQVLKEQWQEAEWGNMKQWYDTQEKRMANHYSNIGLKYPYRRLRVNPVWNSMMTVASELLDSGVVPRPYSDDVFMTKDFAVILLKEQPKPPFIQRISSEDSWSVNKGWELQARNSDRFVEHLEQVGDSFVIGEVTQITKPGDSSAIEDFCAAISYDENKHPKAELFGDSMFQRRMSKYYDLNRMDDHIIIVRDGYFGNNRMKQRWIAINPILATMLGWQSDEEGYFAWKDEDGHRMVESIYWQNGNVNYHGRDTYEMGEGWYVLASKEALNQIRELGTLYAHQLVERHRESDYNAPSSREYKVLIVPK